MLYDLDTGFDVKWLDISDKQSYHHESFADSRRSTRIYEINTSIDLLIIIIGLERYHIVFVESSALLVWWTDKWQIQYLFRAWNNVPNLPVALTNFFLIIIIFPP